jgi:membrane protein
MAKAAAKQFAEDKAAPLSAAMAYYAILSLPALLALVIGILGIVFGRQAVEHNIAKTLGMVLSREGAQAASAIIENTMRHPSSNVVAVVISSVVVLVSAVGLFSQLQFSLNTIWGVEPKPGRGLRATVMDRLPALAMVGLAAVILAASLVASSGINAFGHYLPILGHNAAVMQLLNILFFIVLTAIVFMVVYRYLPDAKTSWGDVWLGALITAVLFAIGQFLLSLYLGLSHVASTYGAAGGVILIMVWIYYSSMVFLFGAEITEVHARQYGSGMEPKEAAVQVREVRGDRQPPEARAA